LEIILEGRFDEKNVVLTLGNDHLIEGVKSAAYLPIEGQLDVAFLGLQGELHGGMIGDE
jgi:hypothetical protein